MNNKDDYPNLLLDLQ